MNTRMLTYVRQLWNCPYVPPSINRANQRKWIASIRLLGDKWLLAKHIQRKKNAH